MSYMCNIREINGTRCFWHHHHHPNNIILNGLSMVLYMERGIISQKALFYGKKITRCFGQMNFTAAQLCGMWLSIFLLITFQRFNWGSGPEIGLPMSGSRSGGPSTTPSCEAGNTVLKNNPILGAGEQKATYFLPG